MQASTTSPVVVCTKLLLRGSVQGCGIRPTIAKIATSNALKGDVRNSQAGVEITLYGDRSSIASFCTALRELTSGSLQVLNENLARSDLMPEDFQIVSSDNAGVVDAIIPLDLVTCRDCLSEVTTPGNRRFGYALNSCARCGPRYSILRSMPYDRCRTSLSGFPMCDDCQQEYGDATHRRFHAQNNCCPTCGPQIWFASPTTDTGAVAGCLALDAVADAIDQGKIAAIKGVGGYQLVCDARREESLLQLRQRKRRASKPLALMVGSLETARSIAKLDKLESEALCSPAGPIVVVQSKLAEPTAACIHPGLAWVGVMLPTTAMHALMIQRLKRPLVVTSGNIEGEPIEMDAEAAELRLAGVADCFLHHDRPILRPIDDSVVRCMAGRTVTLRAARGLAPMSVETNLSSSSCVAVGGEQKSAIALSNGRRTYLGPHLGELDTLRSRERFVEQVQALMELIGVETNLFACDMHPGYFTTTHVESMPDIIPTVVQHHHAHIVAAMAEHGWLDRQVLGFACDGTGLGADNTVWGGEVLLATAHTYQRVAHLLPFRLAGGEAAIREPWRVAVALLSDCGYDVERIASWLRRPEETIRAVLGVLASSTVGLAPVTSSLGRLFDGVAVLVESITDATAVAKVNFEGEAAMRLESMCSTSERGQYTMPLTDDVPSQIDWRPMLRNMVDDLQSRVPAGLIAMRFHRGLADCIRQLATQYPELPVVLCGGVFQNRVLVELVAETLEGKRADSLGTPGRVPANDGGLALGQLVVTQSQRR